MLLLEPTWSERGLTPDEVVLSNKIYRIFLRVTTGRAAIRRQISEVRAARGEERIATLTGNIIDLDFKTQIVTEKERGALPEQLQITRRGKRGPDLWFERIAWDITTAEQASAHVKRDVHLDEFRWDVYFVLGY